MINRKDLLEEKFLRENVRKMLKIALQKRTQNNLNEEYRLRSAIRGILLEKTAVADKVPHRSTAINVLEDLLKKIIPVIETDFKSLTTDPEQRESFRTHLVNGIENLLAPSTVNMAAPGDAPELTEGNILELFLNEQDVNVDLVGAPDEEKLIDIGREQDQPEEVPPDEEDGFAGGLEDADLDATGRNMAYSSFKKFEKAIVDAYDILSNDEDRVTFEDSLKTNVLLYLDKFEDELASAGSLPEPSTPEYEQEVGGGGEMMPPEELPPGPPPEELPPEEQVLQEYIELNI